MKQTKLTAIALILFLCGNSQELKTKDTSQVTLINYKDTVIIDGKETEVSVLSFQSDQKWTIVPSTKKEIRMIERRTRRYERRVRKLYK